MNDICWPPLGPTLFWPAVKSGWLRKASVTEVMLPATHVVSSQLPPPEQSVPGRSCPVPGGSCSDATPWNLNESVVVSVPQVMQNVDASATGGANRNVAAPAANAAKMPRY